MAKAVTKVVHSLDLPYPSLQWPALSNELEQTLVGLLCDLLRPIGDHRRQNVVPSNGKRRRCRRKITQPGNGSLSDQADMKYPEKGCAITLGFNSTVRCLERMTQGSVSVIQGGDEKAEKTNEHDISRVPAKSAASGESHSDLAVVFVARSTLPEMLTSSLPLLAATASLNRPQKHHIRLVPLSGSSEGLLAQALGQPRAGILGIEENGPASQRLISLVRDQVRPVEVPWLRAAADGNYLPTKIKSTEHVTTQSDRKKRKRVEGGVVD